MPHRRRLVFDANVIVSALLLPRSVPRQAFDKASKLGKILASAETLRELDEVLRRPHLDRYLKEEERLRFLAVFMGDVEIVTVAASVSDCRDQKDNRYLDLAISGSAACIVTGDGDLLDMNPYRGISIINPRAFLDTDV